MNLINRIKGKLHALVFWQTNAGDLVNQIYGLRIFYKYAFNDKKLKSKENYEAFLTKQYHIIEKGLALPAPRKGFGKPKILLLISHASAYRDSYGSDMLIDRIQQTLKSYLANNLELENQDKSFYDQITGFGSSLLTGCNLGGVKTVRKNQLIDVTSIDFESFAKSRTSVRNFSSEDVDPFLIEKAVEIARFAPSVCNRQSWKVHHITNRSIKNKLLKLQGGNGGFTDSINQLLIVTTEVSKFTKMESNQIFVDGGLFSMNLLLSLHSQNIASCCLNTCFTFIVENKVKEIAKIPKSQRLIMMIGIGNFKDIFEVAISNRIEVDEILSR